MTNASTLLSLYDIPLESHSHTLIYAFLSLILTVMARSAAGKAEKPRIPEINWSADKSSAIWALLEHIEKPENYRVLYGKKTVGEVSIIFSLSRS